jgi:hypothetical protein
VFNGDVPLRRLRIPIVRIRSLLDCSSTYLGLSCNTRRGHLRKLERRNSGGILVCIGVDGRLRVALVVVLDLAESGNSEDAEACAKDGLPIIEWTPGKADARIEVAKIRLPEAFCQAFLAIRYDTGARQRV